MTIFSCCIVHLPLLTIIVQTVIGLIPASYLIQCLPVGKFLATASLLWSILTTLYAPCRTWGGFMALRFIMGFLEAAITPSITYIIVAFYKKEEQAPRNASKPPHWSPFRYRRDFPNELSQSYLPTSHQSSTDSLPSSSVKYLIPPHCSSGSTCIS